MGIVVVVEKKLIVLIYRVLHVCTVAPQCAKKVKLYDILVSVDVDNLIVKIFPVLHAHNR